MNPRQNDLSYACIIKESDKLFIYICQSETKLFEEC